MNYNIFYFFYKNKIYCKNLIKYYNWYIIYKKNSYGQKGKKAR